RVRGVGGGAGTAPRPGRGGGPALRRRSVGRRGGRDDAPERIGGQVAAPPGPGHPAHLRRGADRNPGWRHDPERPRVMNDATPLPPDDDATTDPVLADAGAQLRAGAGTLRAADIEVAALRRRARRRGLVAG